MKALKLILIFVTAIYSIGSFAVVKKVNAYNAITNKTYTATFGNHPEMPIEKMQPWLDRQKAKMEKCKGWGCTKDVQITITDLTEQYEQEQAAIEARKLEISQIKQAINLIDSSDKPLWEKKLLKRLVKELKE